MRLLTFAHRDGALRLGVSTTRGVLDVAAAARHHPALAPVGDPEAFVRSGRDGLDRLRPVVADLARLPDALFVEEASLAFGPCVPRPGKVLCVGLNYRKHAHETGKDVPSTPILFGKFGNSVAAHGARIALPDLAMEYDYEAELVVVIGRTARRVSADRALDHVLGYCNGNDLSARDLQSRTSQWLLGKSLDGFLPLGPYLVSADEVGDPQRLSVRAWLNGELRQDSTTADMVFGVAEIVSYASHYMTLDPGDVIATGTPEGVILGRPGAAWVRPGDVVEVEVGPLGRLVNGMVAGPSMPGAASGFEEIEGRDA